MTFYIVFGLFSPERGTFLTHSVDELILDGVLLLLGGAVHAGRPSHCFLPYVAPRPAGRLHPPLHVVRRLRHVRGLDRPQPEGAAAYGLAVQQQSERVLSLGAHRVAHLVRAVLVVRYLCLCSATPVRRRYLCF